MSDIVLSAPARTGDLDHDGRSIGWSEWGPASGVAIVFCTGAGMTSSMGFGADVLDALGARLLCVDRAGLGRSSPDPDKSVVSYARDVDAVLDQLAIARAGVVGFSQGAPFAVAVGALPRARALAIVAGTDELAHPSMRAHVAPDMLRFIDAIAHDAAGFEQTFATQVDATGLWSLILAMSAPADQAVYAQPAFAAAYQATLADGFAQGPAGYVRDFVLATSPWAVPPERVRVPVALWYGTLDTSPVHSPDHGRTLATRFPHATLRMVEGGASLLWTRAGDILADLVASTVAA